MAISQTNEDVTKNMATAVEGSTEKQDLNDLDNILVKTAKDWSQYLQVDTTQYDNAIQDLSEDLMIRLNEFDQLLSMSKDDTGHCLFKQMPAIQENYHKMEPVFKNIDNLSLMVSRIKSDMDKLDKKLTEAEATIETTGAMPSFVPSLIGGARNFIGNSAAGALIRNSATESGQSSSIQSMPSPATYEPVTIFCTEDFFGNSQK